MSKNSLALALALLAPVGLHAQSFESAANIGNENGNVTVTGPIREAPTAVLFDQGPLTNGVNGTTPISILQNAPPFNYCTLGSAATGAFRIADDFTVPAGQIWTVNSVTVFGYQTGATAASINNATLRILDGSPTGTPNTLFGDQTTNRVGTVTLSGAFRVSTTTLTATNRALQAIQIQVSPALQLPAGSYWIDFNAAGTVASGPFFPPVVPNITAPAPTGNALQFATTWVPLTQATPNPDCNTTLPGPAQGVPFQVEGTSASTTPPSITVTKRVQLSANVADCDAATTTVQLPFGGGSVYYCYRATNTGTTALGRHTVTDTAFAAPIASSAAIALAPAATSPWILSPALNVTQGNTSSAATWTACVDANPCTGAAGASTAVATVNAGVIVAGVAQLQAPMFSTWSLALLLLGVTGLSAFVLVRRNG